MKAQLYIHIPFCKSKCAYCDFASYLGRLEWAGEYIDRVCADMDAARAEYGAFSVPTVFIGGGTPSLLRPDMIGRLMDHARQNFCLEADAEISMEANPGTVDEASLRGYRQTGINRLSLGVQSADDGLLRGIGRIHTRRQAEEAFYAARRAGFENINLDLMYGLPGQSQEMFEDTVRWAVELGPEHLSLYNLILEEGTPLYESGVEVPGDEECLRMQRFAIDCLAAHGYDRYEISNYARQGFACRHNLGYWRRCDYLGLGCAAHSLMRGQRFEQPRDLAAYMQPHAVERENMDEEDVRLETLMLGLRTREGIDAKWVDAHRAAPMKEFLALENGRAYLTQAGMEVMDEVVRRLL